MPITSGRARSGSRSRCPRSSPRRRFARAGTAAREQSPGAATHDRTQRRAGLGELPPLRVRPLARVNPFERSPDSLLSVPRLGRLAASRWSCLQEPTGPAGLVGSARVDRSDAAAPGARVDRTGAEAPGCAAAHAADPTTHREQTIQRELVRVGKGVERLLTAYQEECM